MNNEQIMMLLYIALGVVVLIVLSLITFLVLVKVKDIKEKKRKNDNSKIKSKNDIDEKEKQEKQSVFDFMEFDKIEDNMIIQKNGNRFIMVVNCQGINYDLMSNVEKAGVEEGFIQFLNTLRHPIQLYIQTKTVNLEDSVDRYKERAKVFEDKLKKMKIQYKQMSESGKYSTQELTKMYYEITKQENLVEYGQDIIYNTEKMSSNRNVLMKQYYVVISYYASEINGGDFDKEEIKNIAFSELYTKAQSIIRTLYVCGVNGKVLNSNELIDLLYTAYNRDDSEIFNAKKILNAGFEDIYSTAPDVLDKKMKAIDEQIEIEALKLAQEKVEEARTEKEEEISKKENDMEELIKDMAKLIIRENAGYIGQDIVETAEEKINNTKRKNAKDKNEEVENGNIQKKRKTRKSTKTA